MNAGTFVLSHLHVCSVCGCHIVQYIVVDTYLGITLASYLRYINIYTIPMMLGSIAALLVNTIVLMTILRSKLSCWYFFGSLADMGSIIRST